MAGIIIARFARLVSPYALRFHHSYQTQIPNTVSSFSPLSTIRPFSTTTTTPETPISNTPTPPPQKRNTLVNFSLSDSEDSDSEATTKEVAKPQIDKSKLPPPYDPFNKKPVIDEPQDPTNLQEVFQKIRSDGLINNAVKMFDGLSKDGLTHEALELFSQIKDKNQMPDVVAHTAVIEAYANARQHKEAHKVYLRMLSSGVLPNAYTYSVLIKALAESGEEKFLKEAKKYVLEMVEKRGMKPNAGICLASFEGLVKAGMEEEGKELLQIVKRNGAVPEESKMKEALKNKRGLVYRTIMQVFYAK
ncbi:pentatricopeptide repeat-containing protein At4g38150-like [Lycium barbarum]|uniref:pentatricopeptide repeat-containing protein At4g38150-like n=1 Tax=Lycium barbarum TaxID=112863 RepID=UPI00293F61B9|nr:pentatricopeptide repeat-containing protein At4g38150-like [Lycium barbarum]